MCLRDEHLGKIPLSWSGGESGNSYSILANYGWEELEPEDFFFNIDDITITNRNVG